MSLVLLFCWQELDHIATRASGEVWHCSLVLYWGEGKNEFWWIAAVSATADIFQLPFVR